MALNVFKQNDKLKSSEVNENFEGLADGTEMHYTGAWNSYTPEWRGTSGTVPDIGNGTLAGRYIRLGRLVICRVFFKAGSSTTYGSGAWNISLPPIRPSIDDYNNSVIGGDIGSNFGVAYYEDLATLGYFGSVDIAPIDNSFRLLVHRSDSTYGVENWITPTVPFTWASGDFWSVLFMYEGESSIV